MKRESEESDRDKQTDRQEGEKKRECVCVEMGESE